MISAIGRIKRTGDWLRGYLFANGPTRLTKIQRTWDGVAHGVNQLSGCSVALHSIRVPHFTGRTSGHSSCVSPERLSVKLLKLHMCSRPKILIAFHCMISFRHVVQTYTLVLLIELDYERKWTYEHTTASEIILPLCNEHSHVAVEDLAGRAYHDGKVARLHDILHLTVPKTPSLDLEIDFDSLALASLDEDLLEASQVVSGDIDTGDDILNVDLDDLGTVAFARVGHFHGDSDNIIRSHGSGRGGDVADVEGCVGQAVSKVVQCRRLSKHIAVSEFHGAVGVLLATAMFVPAA